MALYRVNATFWINSTPKHARKKAERLLVSMVGTVQGHLQAEPPNISRSARALGKVERVTKLTGRKKPKRGADQRTGLARRRRTEGPHIPVRTRTLADGSVVTKYQMWRFVQGFCGQPDTPTRMPSIWGSTTMLNSQVRGRAHPGRRPRMTFPTDCRVSLTTFLHECVHICLGRDDQGLYHGDDFYDTERGCVAAFQEQFGAI